MSLIQEALRRQQEDMDDNSGAPPPTAPTTPAPAPTEAPTIARKAPVNMAPPDLDTATPPPVQPPPAMGADEPPPPPPEASADGGESPPEPPAEKKAGKPGVKIAVVVAGAVLCLALGIYAVTYAISSFGTKPPAPDAPDSNPDVAAPAEAPDTTEVVAGVPDDLPPEAVPVETVTVDPTTPVEVKAPPVPAVPVKRVVEWPLLIVNQLVGGKKGGSAMINGEIVGIGGTVEGVTITAINKYGVTLKFEGETKTLKQNESTE
jgi:hypothetical protein